jgi:GNAT superfamily N-acetyltransferase
VATNDIHLLENYGFSVPDVVPLLASYNLKRRGSMTNDRNHQVGRRVRVTDEGTGKTRDEFWSSEELLDAFFPIRRETVWAELAADFPQRAKPNAVTYTRRAGKGCLVAYDASGDLVGMLFYHYQTGKIDVVVRKDKRRQGFGKKLSREALRRWHIDWSKQTTTPDGGLLIEAIQ